MRERKIEKKRERKRVKDRERRDEKRYFPYADLLSTFLQFPKTLELGKVEVRRLEPNPIYHVRGRYVLHTSPAASSDAHEQKGRFGSGIKS